MILDGITYRYPGPGGFTLGPLEVEGPEDRPWLVLGPTGSGKSTLLRILGGNLKPDRGTFGGWNPRTDGAYLPQLPERALAGRNLAEDLCGEVRPSHARRARLRRSLAEVGLAGVALSRRSRDLSAGERRRVALALLILAHRPGWALDEPEAGLDAMGTRRLLEILLGRCRGAAGRCWIGTHRFEVYGGLRPWVLVLEGGRLLGAGEWAGLAKKQRIAAALNLPQRPEFRLRSALEQGIRTKPQRQGSGSQQDLSAQVFAWVTDRDIVP